MARHEGPADDVEDLGDGGAAVLLGLWSSAAAWYFHAHGWTYYYGDAEAHLNIARRVLDSRTPGYDQIGTVWLPLPHLLILPLLGRDDFWRNGLAATIPMAAGFALGCSFLFAALRRAFRSTAAAAAGTAIVALNPNFLYLQSTAMTEAPFFASLAALFFFSVRFRDT